jgi:hypothetical protein
VSERQLDEQIRQAFTALTRAPRPQLTERIRDSLWRQPAAGGRLTLPPVALPPPLPVVVAGLVVVALVAALVEGPAALRAASAVGRGVNAAVARVLSPPRTASTPGGEQTAAAHPSPSQRSSATPTSTPTPVPSATPTPAPTAPPPTAPVATLPGFSCAAQSGGGGQSTMSTARVGAQSGYDRFVIQFSGPVPQYDVTLQDSASFAQSGGPVTLKGSAGLAVVLHNASGAGAYTGPGDVTPGFPQIQEARLLSDSQGVVQWGVGIAHPACFHAWVLSGPSRLVVDIAT